MSKTRPTNIIRQSTEDLDDEIYSSKKWLLLYSCILKEIKIRKQELQGQSESLQKGWWRLIQQINVICKLHYMYLKRFFLPYLYIRLSSTSFKSNYTQPFVGSLFNLRDNEKESTFKPPRLIFLCTLCTVKRNWS